VIVIVRVIRVNEGNTVSRSNSSSDDAFLEVIDDTSFTHCLLSVSSGKQSTSDSHLVGRSKEDSRRFRGDDYFDTQGLKERLESTLEVR